MNSKRKDGICALMLALSVGVAHAANAPDTVMILKPGDRVYSDPEPVADTVGGHWEYAVLSENAYDSKMLAPAAADCRRNASEPLPIGLWQQLHDVSLLNPEEQGVAERLGLVVQAWVKQAGNGEPLTIAVVFRGSDDKKDWWSNLRWVTRFIPGFKDQYTETAEKVGPALIRAISSDPVLVQAAKDRQLRLVTAGHSLGGGLAQYLAYSLPAATTSDGVEIPRISHVYAFDSSPVTGWFSVPDAAQRDRNARSLQIERIFEHGEILAYPRLLARLIAPAPEKDPSIYGVRYNFFYSRNVFRSHSMRLLACAIAQAAGQEAYRLPADEAPPAVASSK